MRRRIYGLFLIFMIVVVFALTFQSASGTVALSEAVRRWIKTLGIHSSFHTIRSNAHIVLYFALGLVLTLYGREIGLSTIQILFTGCGVGFVDEFVKIFLPTREFDFVDLLKDWLGILSSILLILLLTGIRRKANRNSIKNE